MSEAVARESSVAALGIAAHEVSHAYQDAEGSRSIARAAPSESTGFTDPEETEEVERVLRAAALTYVVGLLQQLGLLFALVLVAEATRRVAT